MAAAQVSVQLPNLFDLVRIDENVRKNASYVEANAESVTWLHGICSFPDSTLNAMKGLDIGWFCAIAVPDAPKDRLKTFCDWGNFVFPFDDFFDGGHLSSNPEEARDMVESLLATMYGRTYPQQKIQLVRAHDEIFERVAEGSSHEVTRRFADAVAQYTEGVLAQVDQFSLAEIPSLEKMLAMRRKSIGTAPLIALMQYAENLRVPDDVLEHSVLQELQDLAIEVVVLTNDMLSYPKEELDGNPHNCIVSCRANGASAQQAYDEAAQLMALRVSQWEEMKAHIPSWDEEIDAQVERFVGGIWRIVQANADWSFKSQRYFGKDSKEIVKTWSFKVLESPWYLKAGAV